jgi:hypothetical protein
MNIPQNYMKKRRSASAKGKKLERFKSIPSWFSRQLL